MSTIFARGHQHHRWSRPWLPSPLWPDAQESPCNGGKKDLPKSGLGEYAATCPKRWTMARSKWLTGNKETIYRWQRLFAYFWVHVWMILVSVFNILQQILNNWHVRVVVLWFYLPIYIYSTNLCWHVCQQHLWPWVGESGEIRHTFVSGPRQCFCSFALWSIHTRHTYIYIYLFIYLVYLYTLYHAYTYIYTHI